MKIIDLLLINSFSLDGLIEDYRIFFLSILPSVFILACLVEYFDRLNVFALVKRALIAILVLTSVTSFYKVSIDYSIEAAQEKLNDQKSQNILLMNLFDASKYLDKNEKETNGFFAYLKQQFFTSFINDSFTVGVYFFSQLGFLILKVVYSLVYYLGYGLVGIPCLLYLFPTMGNVLRGAVLSYVSCLIVPHILVFLLSLIGSEINSGYTQGQIIGGSVLGTAMLFILSLFIALSPFIGMMIINGSGIAQAGGIISLAATNMVRGIPSQGINSGAKLLTGRGLGPKGTIAMNTMKFASSETNRGARFLANKIKGGSIEQSTKTNKYGGDSKGAKTSFNDNSSTRSSGKSTHSNSANNNFSKRREAHTANGSRSVQQKYTRTDSAKFRPNVTERKTHTTNRRQGDQSRKNTPSKRTR